MKSVLYIVGAGGFGREVYQWACDAAVAGAPYTVAGCLDDNPDALAAFSGGPPLLGSINGEVPSPEKRYVVAIGTPTVRRSVVASLAARGAQFATVQHPSAYVGARVTVGEGGIVCPGVIMTCDIRVGAHCAFNLQTTLGHDVRVGAFCQLSAFVDLTGGVELGEAVFAGSHATVIPGVKVGDGARIGAGSTVIKAVPAGASVFGVPARPL